MLSLNTTKEIQQYLANKIKAGIQYCNNNNFKYYILLVEPKDINHMKSNLINMETFYDNNEKN